MRPEPPTSYVTSLVATGAEATVEAPPRPVLPVDALGDLDWAAHGWSPELMLLASVSACFWSTLRALADRRGLTIHRLGCRATGQVENRNGGRAFTKIDLAIDIEVDPSAFCEADGLVESARRWCAVARSLRCPVVVSSIATTTSEARLAP